MLEIGSVLDGKYKILNKIGQGGMSIVYLAMNEKANKQWAIKEVRKDGVKDFEVVKQGLMCEVEMLKKFNHPHLPSIVDVIETNGTFLIVMDYIEGKPLSNALNDFGAQTQENVIIWGKQLCDVLGYLHSQNPPIIYRDMKPANIMIKPDGNIMLIDFGTAREFKENNLADTTCLGTQGYAAPEQFGGQGQTDPRTDIYTLGATLYHLVTGHNPCEPPYEMYPIRQWNPTLSSGLEKIITKCIQKNPEDRYQSCAELMYDLEHYDEIDENYKKKQKKKLIFFIVAASLSIILGVSSIISFILSSKIKSSDYTHMLHIGNYLEAISIDPSKEEAYLNLIKKYKLDANFTDEEANEIRVLENNKDIDKLKINPEKYAEVSYQIAIAYWFYNQSDQLKKLEATKWFTFVSSVPDNSLGEKYKKYKRRAEILKNIGTFYKNEDTLAQEGGVDDTKESYLNYWNNICALMNSDDGKNEFDTIKILNEVVKESVERKIKLNKFGVSNDKLVEMINNVKIRLTRIDSTNKDINEQKHNLLTLCDSNIRILRK